MLASRLHHYFRETLDIINMLQCRQWSDPCDGFSSFAYCGTGPPIIKLMTENHLNQSLTMQALEYTSVPRPVEANYDENLAEMRLNTWRFSGESETIIGLPSDGKSTNFLLHSKRKPKHMPCDTCKILTMQQKGRSNVDDRQMQTFCVPRSRGQ